MRQSTRVATGSAEPGSRSQARTDRRRVPMSDVVSIADLIACLGGPWQQVDVVEANDAIVRLARFEGEFPWHHHDEDELFLCWDGSFRVEIQGRDPVTLRAGELFVVLRGMEHRPVAEERAHGLMLERPETKQYGNDGPGTERRVILGQLVFESGHRG